MIPYSMTKCLITIGVEESDDNKAFVYVNERKKREWLADILDSINLTIETLDSDYEDINSLHNLMFLRGQVNKFLENLSEGTRSVMSYYFLTSNIFQLITVKFWAEIHRVVSFL